MAIASTKAECFQCNKDKIVYECEGCSNDFCINHLIEHRQILSQQLDRTGDDRDQFQQTIFEEKQNPQNSCLIEQINRWEQNSIDKIKQTAEKCRLICTKYLRKHVNNIEKEFVQLTELIRELRQENEFNEIDLNHLTNTLTKLNQELIQPSNIFIQEDPSPSVFINKISVISSEPTICKQHAITIAGGYEKGNQLNQLSFPHAIFVDNDNTIYIADSENNRIVQWKSGEKEGQVIAGGNGNGNRNDQLNYPTDIIIEKQSNSLIIADRQNRRVMRCSSENQQVLISDIDCYGLRMDKNGFIYVSDCVKNEVRRWKQGEKEGIKVAGGNGRGNRLNQLSCPTFIFVDDDSSVYISDCENHRVMKWRKDAKEGIIVAGGNGQGDSLKQLSEPHGVIVDHFGHIYVVESGNDRVVCWCEGSTEGSIVLGGNGVGNQSNQLNFPSHLSFDVEGNLYVVDSGNARIQKFEVDFD